MKKTIKIFYVLMIFLFFYCSNKISHYKTLIGHSSNITNLSFHKNSKKFVSVSIDGKIKIWDLYTGKNIKVLEGFKSSGLKVKFINKINYLIVYNHEDRIKIYNLKENKNYIFKPEIKKIINVFINDSGELVYVVSANKGLVKINLKKYEITYNKSFVYKINSVCKYIKENQFFISTTDGELILYDFYANKILKKFTTHKSYLRNLTYSPVSKLIAGVDIYNDIIIWDLNFQKKIKSLKLHDFNIITLKFSKKGNNIFSTDEAGNVKLSNIKSGVLLWQTKIQGNPYLSKDNEIIAGVSSFVIRLYKK